MRCTLVVDLFIGIHLRLYSTNYLTEYNQLAWPFNLVLYQAREKECIRSSIWWGFYEFMRLSTCPFLKALPAADNHTKKNISFTSPEPDLLVSFLFLTSLSNCLFQTWAIRLRWRKERTRWLKKARYQFRRVSHLRLARPPNKNKRTNLQGWIPD